MAKQRNFTEQEKKALGKWKKSEFTLTDNEFSTYFERNCITITPAGADQLRVEFMHDSADPSRKPKTDCKRITGYNEGAEGCKISDHLKSIASYAKASNELYHAAEYLFGMDERMREIDRTSKLLAKRK